MAKLKIFILPLFFLALSGACVAQSWLLVTPEEVKAYSDSVNQSSLSIRSSPAPFAPEIIIEAPDLSKIVVTPTNIKVVFRAADGARIRPESFKVRYGAFGFDVTSRILSRYRPSESGIIVADVGLPAGNHILTMSVTDSLGREGNKRVQLSVQQPER